MKINVLDALKVVNKIIKLVSEFDPERPAKTTFPIGSYKGTRYRIVMQIEAEPTPEESK